MLGPCTGGSAHGHGRDNKHGSGKHRQRDAASRAKAARPGGRDGDADGIDGPELLEPMLAAVAGEADEEQQTVEDARIDACCSGEGTGLGPSGSGAARTSGEASGAGGGAGADAHLPARQSRCERASP